MLLQNKDRHPVSGNEFRRSDFGGKALSEGGGQKDAAKEQRPDYQAAEMQEMQWRNLGLHGFPCCRAADGASGCFDWTGIKVPTVRASSIKYCLATRWTSLAVTALMRSRN